MSEIHFLTFGDGNEDNRAAGTRLADQATETGWFSSAQTLHQEHLEHLSPSWYAAHRAFIGDHARGFGYWIWKPFVILETLKRLPSGDILVYADAGFEISRTGRGKFEKYVAEAQENDFLFFEIGHEIQTWTKGDLLDYFGLAQGASLRRKHQIQASLLFLKRTSRSLLLASHWAELAVARNYSLIDDTPSSAPNSEDFAEHRHDQSILSLLVRMQGLGSVVPSEDYQPDLWAAGNYVTENPFHAFRNKTGRRMIGK